MTTQPQSSSVLEILVVDDDLYLLAAIKQTLVLNGFAVQTFSNPVEALASLEGHLFAAVLADIRMPEMDGMVLLERILAKDADLPVILITGHGDISMAVEAVKKGAYHFLQKPVDEDIILATLSRSADRPTLVIGIAAETETVEDHARAKLTRKGCDWIVANDVSPATGIMGGTENAVTLISKDGAEVWPRMSKQAVVQQLAARIAEALV